MAYLDEKGLGYGRQNTIPFFVVLDVGLNELQEAERVDVNWQLGGLVEQDHTLGI